MLLLAHLPTATASSETVSISVDAAGSTPSAFDLALQLNAAEHEAQMEMACSHYYCGVAADYAVPPMSRWSMGSLPLNDFSDALEGEDQIFVSDDPRRSPRRAAR